MQFKRDKSKAVGEVKVKEQALVRRSVNSINRETSKHENQGTISMKTRALIMETKGLVSSECCTTECYFTMSVMRVLFICFGDWEQVSAIRSPVIVNVPMVVGSGKCSPVSVGNTQCLCIVGN